MSSKTFLPAFAGIRVILDPRQKTGVPLHECSVIERSKYQPHTGKKQIAKARTRTK